MKANLGVRSFGRAGADITARDFVRHTGQKRKPERHTIGAENTLFLTMVLGRITSIEIILGIPCLLYHFRCFHYFDSWPHDPRRDSTTPTHIGKLSNLLPFLLPSLLLCPISYPMRNKQILAKEILRKVIKLDVVSSQAISSCNTAHASQLVHILALISNISSLIILKKDLPPTSNSPQTTCDSFH